MNKTVLIIGTGPGLGTNLLQSLTEFEQKIAVSRSDFHINDSIQHIKCDIADLDEHIAEIDSKISLVIYLPSEFGESKELKDSQYDAFIATAPKGLLSTFNSLKDAKKLETGALFISIGSTASEFATTSLLPQLNPVYSVAKLTQKALTAKLAHTHKEYRFATITLGAIGDEKTGIGYKHICQTVSHLYQISPRVAFSEIELIPTSDIE